MKAVALYEGGVNFRMQYAVREDASVFKRFMEHSQYGYGWGRWTNAPDIVVDVTCLPWTLPAGFGEARIISREPRVRLPKE